MFLMKKTVEQLQDSAIIPIGTYWQLVRRRFLKHRLALLGLIFLVIVTAFSLLGPLFIRTTYDEFDLSSIFAPPFSKNHLFGTDELGRDVLVRVMYGGRISLFVGFVSSLITTAIGLLVGLISGYFGGIVDRLLMRFVDVMLSIPLFPILLILTMVFGSGLTNTIWCSRSLAGWVSPGL